MTEISRRFEQLISAAQKKLTEQNQILPVRTEQGILVGDVLIKSRDNLKDLWKNNEIIYADISLNEVAIKLANLTAKNINGMLCDKIYKADQDYGKWFIEWQILKNHYHKAKQNGDLDRADIFLARYESVKIKAEQAKNHALGLVRS